MEIRSSFPILYVDDVPAAVRFYRDLLGFEEIYRFPDSGEPGYVWGARVAYLEDPDGNPVHIRGPVAGGP